MNRFVETYASDVLPLHAKHGFDLVGGWSRAGGTGQQVVHLHRFDDLAAYERARASIAGDAAVAAMVEDHAREVSVTESIVLGETTAYATDARLKQGRVREGDAPFPVRVGTEADHAAETHWHLLACENPVGNAGRSALPAHLHQRAVAGRHSPAGANAAREKSATAGAQAGSSTKLKVPERPAYPL